MTFSFRSAIWAIAPLMLACGTSNGAGFADPLELAGDDGGSPDAADAPLGARSRGGPSPDAAVLGVPEAGPPPTPAIAFVLVDAAVTTNPSGRPVQGFDPIPEGARLDMAFLGDRLTILAVPRAGVAGSVRFTLDGAVTHVEESAPYSLCGDDGKGTFNACALTSGKHTLVAETYGAADLDGGLRTAATLDFTVFDAPAAPDAGQGG